MWCIVRCVKLHATRVRRERFKAMAAEGEIPGRNREKDGVNSTRIWFTAFRVLTCRGEGAIPARTDRAYACITIGVSLLMATVFDCPSRAANRLNSR